MKLYIYSFLLFLITSVALGSSDFEAISAASSDNESDHELAKHPETIKHELMSAIRQARLPEAKYYIKKNSFLTEKFNRDVFSELFNCFHNEGKEQNCWEIFELLKPSFADVSKSTTTPLILAIRAKQMDLVHALLKTEEVRRNIDNTDEFDRTALMYAAKRGSYFAVKRIIDISTESINFKDFRGMTAIHYGCEMNPVKKFNSNQFELPYFLTGEIDPDVKNKISIVTMLLSNGGKIVPNGPEYKLTPDDSDLAELIRRLGGKVLIKTPPSDILDKSLKTLALIRILNFFKLTGFVNHINAALINFFLANPILRLVNDICFGIQQYVLPGIDMNFVVSIDLGNSVQDFSFNLFFIILMAPVIKNLIESSNKKQIFDF